MTPPAPAGGGAARPWRHAAYLVASGSTQAAVAFGSNLVLVRHVAPEGFGRFALTLATLTLVYAFGSLRPGALVVREGRGQDDARRALLWNACLQEAALLGAASAALLALGGAGPFEWALWAGVLTAHLASQARGFLERHQAFGRLSAIESGAHLAAHGAAVVAVLLGAGVWALPLREGLLALLQLGGLAAVGGLPRAALRPVRPAQWRAIARDARDLWTDGLLEGLHTRLVVLAAGWIGGVRGAGLFFQAHRLALVPHQFLQPLAGRLSFVWYARAADESERARQRRRLLLLLAGPLLLSTLACAFLAESAVPWILGESWRDAAPLLASLAAVAGGTSLLALAKTELLATARFRALLAMRAAQFAGLALAPLALWIRPELGVRALGLALGAGIALALLSATRSRRAPRARSDADADRPADAERGPARAA